ncbi:MAG: GNAT family N-acetyltransferase [Candidatus Eremiobacteraeota bacterium]|nr:GNAT family N-acetyltransferase [Candidatus Eremiobacteraeota bacterium]
MLFTTSHSTKKCHNLLIDYALVGDIKDIKDIADRNRDSLGFIVRSAVSGSIEKKEVLIARYRKEVVGFLIFHQRRDSQVTIYDICVKLEFRRRQIGKRLIEELILESRRNHKSIIKLKCPDGLSANFFYEGIGFKLTGKEPGKKRRLNIWQIDIQKNEENKIMYNCFKLKEIIVPFTREGL